MPSATSEVERVLSAIIEALDAAGGNDGLDSPEHRGESRRLLRAHCELWTCSAVGRMEGGHGFVTRNISFRGVSVVGNLTCPLRIGRPVEVVITMPNKTHKHVAGTVAFCRQVDNECYEIGTHVLAAGSSWIVAGDVNTSAHVYDWFDKALCVPE